MVRTKEKTWAKAFMLVKVSNVIERSQSKVEVFGSQRNHNSTLGGK
jgi:hypothetical protein